MTKPEFDEMVALVVRLRKELEHTNQHLVAHIDALTKSNAQCAEYLRHNEMLRAELDRISAERDTMQTKLHSELVNVRAALAATTEQRDSLKRTLDEWERADTKPHERITADDVADHVVPPVLPLCNVCHGCGTALTPYGTVLRCPNQICGRTTTGTLALLFNPYHDTCKSATPVRHE